MELIDYSEFQISPKAPTEKKHHKRARGYEKNTRHKFIP